MSNYLLRKILENPRTVNLDRLYPRNSLISGYFEDRKAYVYNGISSKTVSIQKNSVGLRFGEFSFTKRIGRKIHNS